MNPFDLRGPEFLVFYTVFGAATLAIVHLLLNRFESDSTTRPIPSDYLEIAYLRGGKNEALRVATMNLVNRGLLEVTSDDRLRAHVAEVPNARVFADYGTFIDNGGWVGLIHKLRSLRADASYRRLQGFRAL